jgi:hypothetical protein
VRATFGIVLLAGVAAAIGLSMALHRGEAARDDSAAPDATNADAPPAAAQPGIALDPAHNAAALPPLAARVEDLLGKNDAPGAARALLSADSKDLKSAAVRERAFQTADALVAAADLANDATATASRLDARRLYATLYACDDATLEDMGRAFTGCARLHQALIFGNGAPESLVLRHKVQAGESVWALAKGPWKQRGVSVPAGFVLHVNGVADARRVRAGQTLRVPLESLRVLVRKSRFELAVLLGGAPIERFPVAIGADASTPAGVFKVRDRIKDPDWYFHGRRVAFGDPQNIIGTRWIGLTGSAAAEGIGIHGTADDASIGKAASAGCVRMHNADVEKLFDWLDAGVDVEIRD